MPNTITIQGLASGSHLGPTFTVGGAITLDRENANVQPVVQCYLQRGQIQIDPDTPATATTTGWQATFTNVSRSDSEGDTDLFAALVTPAGAQPAEVDELTIDATAVVDPPKPLPPPPPPPPVRPVGALGGALAAGAVAPNPTIIAQKFTLTGRLDSRSVRRYSCAFFTSSGVQASRIFEAVIDHDFREYSIRVDLSDIPGRVGSLRFFSEIWPSFDQQTAIPNLKVSDH